MGKIKHRIESVNIFDIKESEINANELPEKSLKRLIKSIKKDGMLTSTVLLMQEQNNYICISGHHRIIAAKKAGLKEVNAIIIDEVDKSTRLRLQLQHNDIVGHSDDSLIVELQKQLLEEDLKLVNELNWEGKEIDNKIKVKQEYIYIEFCVLPETAREFEDLINKFALHDGPKYLIEKIDYIQLKNLLTLAFKNGYKTPGKALRKFLDIINASEEKKSWEAEG